MPKNSVRSKEELEHASNLEKEFEILFKEQRLAVEKATIPLFERMHPDTRKLFTVPFKP
jgi:hypothetical protein